jgi:hypothetical protein
MRSPVEPKYFKRHRENRRTVDSPNTPFEVSATKACHNNSCGFALKRQKMGEKTEKVQRSYSHTQ